MTRHPSIQQGMSNVQDFEIGHSLLEIRNCSCLFRFTEWPIQYRMSNKECRMSKAFKVGHSLFDIRYRSLPLHPRTGPISNVQQGMSNVQGLRNWTFLVRYSIRSPAHPVALSPPAGGLPLP